MTLEAAYSKLEPYIFSPDYEELESFLLTYVDENPSMRRESLQMRIDDLQFEMEELNRKWHFHEEDFDHAPEAGES